MTMPKLCVCSSFDIKGSELISFDMKFHFVERKSGADVADFYSRLFRDDARLW